jgi:anti-anti-sigma factor
VLAVDIKTCKEGEILICILTGEMNIHHSAQLRKTFDEIIKNNEKKVVVDFSSVAFIDTAGLATLIEMLHRLQKIEGHFKLSNLDEKIKKMFETLKINEFFEIYDTRADAIKAF